MNNGTKKSGEERVPLLLSYLDIFIPQPPAATDRPTSTGKCTRPLKSSLPTTDDKKTHKQVEVERGQVCNFSVPRVQDCSRQEVGSSEGCPINVLTEDLHQRPIL